MKIPVLGLDDERPTVSIIQAVNQTCGGILSACSPEYAEAVQAEREFQDILLRNAGRLVIPEVFLLH